MAEIQGIEFSGWWDVDRSKLKGLPFDGRVEWLCNRIDQVLLKPLEALEAVDGKMFVWLAATELVCAGIEALAGFYGNRQRGPGPKMSQFCQFVHTFMDPNFSQKQKNARGEVWTYSQHLKEYFRGGLDHGFSIEWGGLWHDGDDGMMGYLRSVKDGQGIAVDPRLLLRDFRQAVDKYFMQLIEDGEASTIGKNFQKRFTAILEQRSKTY